MDMQETRSELHQIASQKNPLPTMDTDQNDDSISTASREQVMFAKARELINPNQLFRFVTFLYAERKLVVVILAHFLGTMVVWQHFALVKFHEQTANVPGGAHRYWWKVMVPSLEFGTMHAILFQMALIPLTMSRYTISQLAVHTSISKIVPLNRMLAIHIHLGYCMVGFVFIATVFFFSFFGLLCAEGDQSFCDKFVSEIMITGYFIVGFLLLVGITSFFRNKIPYEIFYILHHFVFIIYILTTVHTFDNVQRRGERERSQTFKWISATLLYYVCDRAAMHIHNRFKVPMVSNSLVKGSKSSRMILFKIKRPALFSFQPGQYAFLKIKDIDHQWHPFSIASGPQSDVMEFYMEVFDETSWTGRLWSLLQHESSRTLWVDVMGPYGTPLACTDEFSHVIALGAGTGIVPMLSMLKQHVREVLRLEPMAYFREMEQVQTRLSRFNQARQRGSLFERFVNACCCRTNGTTDRRSLMRSQLRSSFVKHQSGRLSTAHEVEIKRSIQRAVRKETLSFYGMVFLIFMTAYGLSLIGFTFSWCTLGFELYQGMMEVSSSSTCLFFGIFGIMSIGFWQADNIINYVDVAMTIISILVSWYWFVRHLWANFETVHMIHYSLIVGYMTARLWGQTVKSRHQSFRQEVVKSGITTLECLKFVWVTRSASLVSEIMPDINKIWENLVQTWGEETAKKVLQIEVYVTDPNERAVRVLKRQMRGTTLYEHGHYIFDRPNLDRIVEDHTLGMMAHLDNSHTLLAFCGSPKFARDLHVIKINNDISTAITGNKCHQMEYIAESYGGSKVPKNMPVSEKLADNIESEPEEETSHSSQEETPFVPWRKTTNVYKESSCWSDSDEFNYLLGITCGRDNVEISPAYSI